jgi:hypothetical protein
MANENRDDLAGRVAKIEKQLRWWRGCSLLLLLLVGIAALLGMQTAVPERLRVKSLRTESLNVVDNEGRGRANIAVNDGGGVGINVFTQEGALRGTLGVENKTAYLALYSEKQGEPFVQAYMSLRDGKPRIRLRNRDGDDLFEAPLPK